MGLSPGLGHGTCSGNAGAIIIVVVMLQLESVFVGCGVGGLSDFGHVTVFQASLAWGQMMSSR